MKKPVLVYLALLLGCGLLSAQQPPEPHSQARLVLKDGWTLQSLYKVDAPGEVVSTLKLRPQGWYPVTVPTTVVAALVKAKHYPDPYFGMNLRKLPGMTYPIGQTFVSLPMAQDSPFIVPWWFRKEFVIPSVFRGKTIWLNFGGINYRANIWLNGKQIAKADDVAGAWRTYEFDITAAALPGKINVLAVEVFSPTENDLTVNFWDWNPAPPDKQMGIFRDVEVLASGPVALRYPTVISKVDSPGNDAAHVTVTALLKNATQRRVRGILRGHLESIDVAQEVELAPGESKDIVIDPASFPQLNLAHPRLWWPAQMGKPELYKLDLEFEVDGRVSDRSETSFGIREIRSELNAHQHRVFSINGKKILIRGGGWAMDMLLREDQQRMRDELRYVQAMGLNTVRLEGMLENRTFFDLADRQGILVIAGWVCCSHWEHWANWKPQDFVIAEQSLRDQIYRLRGHPSLLLWMNGSDNPPPPDVEQMYLKVEHDLLWPDPVVSSASAEISTITGPSGVKMPGPYDYVAPGYWEQDSITTLTTHRECKENECGGGYGFNTETSMGAAVPPLESIRAMLPKEHWWPIDEWWNFHAGAHVFGDLHLFTTALNARYGAANGVEDFTFKSQLMAYEGVRAMYEAYNRNKYASTGVIQWMLNNAWPSTIWHLYDYYLRPGGGYFGAKNANEGLHPLYGYDDHAIWVVSSQYSDAHALKLTARILNLDMTEKFSQETTFNVPADNAIRILVLPDISGLSPTYFVMLRLQDSSGKVVGSNFYWLSTRTESLDWDKSNWYTTPTLSYADFTALSQLPRVKLKVTSHTERKGEESVTNVVVENPSKSLAFFVRLKITKGPHGEEILPVLWEDNYFSLLPGESREVTAAYRSSALGTALPSVEISGWNVASP
ncbi:MAG TPA: glycoside hydrolase family 2 protein [Terriglobales bacterium]|nr:glycoside hydrolase family 2 protein [Terriglobales bacterium]